MTCPLFPSSIAPEIEPQRVCRFAFISVPLHVAGSGSRPEPEQPRRRSRQGSLEAESDAWYSILEKAKRPLPQILPVLSI